MGLPKTKNMKRREKKIFEHHLEKKHYIGEQNPP